MYLQYCRLQEIFTLGILLKHDFSITTRVHFVATYTLLTLAGWLLRMSPLFSLCTVLKEHVHEFVNLGMTNAEVLHQVEHGYRMQAPQVQYSSPFYSSYLCIYSSREHIQ